MSILRKPGILLAILVLAFTALAIVAPSLLAPYDPYDSVGTARLAPPSWEHLFGTDYLARDVFSRVIYGAQLSISAAGLAVVAGVTLGGIIGLVTGYVRGLVDAVVMRFVDVLIAIPGILLALIVVASLGFGPLSIALGVGLGTAGTFARVMRAQVLRVRSEEYVEAARTLGVRGGTILLRHVLPNAVRPIIAMAALELALAILAVSALSFLGFGAQPPAPEWGALVSSGRDFVAVAPWLSLLPGAVILAVVLSVNRIARYIGGER
ncbi:peptide/nickel transport system permease protein [Microbacterium halimionae]|uniref:Peptide/nickel transport system permease protein n=1 Tax=Microbacterium halimionae TaxID=1526413 RepID=A0A7W3JQI8_9MICO|nr:ABC transporter permease [Microbacterium halimionae]MBA8817150.1 peptide/nickel transport system permease protein [Microbacterium halimionae]NII94600.1 peptide/nickel transport system permease protein [Microbacterium halimionae]